MIFNFQTFIDVLKGWVDIIIKHLHCISPGSWLQQSWERISHCSNFQPQSWEILVVHRCVLWLWASSNKIINSCVGRFLSTLAGFIFISCEIGTVDFLCFKCCLYVFVQKIWAKFHSWNLNLSSWVNMHKTKTKH